MLKEVFVSITFLALMIGLYWLVSYYFNGARETGMGGNMIQIEMQSVCWGELQRQGRLPEWCEKYKEAINHLDFKLYGIAVLVC